MRFRRFRPPTAQSAPGYTLQGNRHEQSVQHDQGGRGWRRGHRAGGDGAVASRAELVHRQTKRPDAAARSAIRPHSLSGDRQGVAAGHNGGNGGSRRHPVGSHWRAGNQRGARRRAKGRKPAGAAQQIRSLRQSQAHRRQSGLGRVGAAEGQRAEECRFRHHPRTHQRHLFRRSARHRNAGRRTTPRFQHRAIHYQSGSPRGAGGFRTGADTEAPGLFGGQGERSGNQRAVARGSHCAARSRIFRHRTQSPLCRQRRHADRPRAVAVRRDGDRQYFWRHSFRLRRDGVGLARYAAVRLARSGGPVRTQEGAVRAGPRQRAGDRGQGHCHSAWLHSQRRHDVAHHAQPAGRRGPARTGLRYRSRGRRANRRYCGAGRGATFDPADGRCGAECVGTGRQQAEGTRAMATHFTRRSALTIIAGCGASMAAGRAWADDKTGRVIYPVAVPVYQSQFVADRIGYFKEAGLDCKLIQGGSGVKTREIVASSQGDIGIGDVTHPMQLANHGRAGRILMPTDTRSSAVMFILRKDLWDQGITTLEKLTEWKRPDGRKPIVSVSSLGGTNHVWSSYYMETMGLDQKVTWIGTGNVDTMLGSLKTRQVDVLVSSLSLLNDSKEQGWGALLFDGTDEGVWKECCGGKVPVTSHFTLQATIDKDPRKMQAFVTAIWRATQWIRTHSPEEIYGVMEPYVGSTSRAANVLEITALQKVADYDATIDAAGFARGEKVWFREMTGIKPLTIAEVVSPTFVEVARKAYPA